MTLPDGREVDLDGCDVCARPDCAAFRMQRGTRQQDMSDADLGRLVIAREVCRNNAVDWRKVARAAIAKIRELESALLPFAEAGPTGTVDSAAFRRASMALVYSTGDEGVVATIAELRNALDNAEKRADIVADKRGEP